MSIYEEDVSSHEEDGASGEGGVRPHLASEEGTHLRVDAEELCLLEEDVST